MLTYGVILESALGLGVDPEGFVESLLSAPGLQPRLVRCQDARLPLKKASLALVASLRSFDESWAVDIEGASGSWGWAMATHLVASRVNEFDSAAIEATVPAPAGLEAWFRRLCERGRAEFAALDVKDATNGLRPHVKAAGLSRGIPGVAWMTWFGSQLLDAAPELASPSTWSRVAQTQWGTLCLASESPPADARRAEIRGALGDRWFFPNAALPLDRSTKNTVTPPWLTADKPPSGVFPATRMKKGRQK